LRGARPTASDDADKKVTDMPEDDRESFGSGDRRLRAKSATLLQFESPRGPAHGDAQVQNLQDAEADAGGRRPQLMGSGGFLVPVVDPDAGEPQIQH
jgi:hypothetical protein